MSFAIRLIITYLLTYYLLLNISEITYLEILVNRYLAPLYINHKPIYTVGITMDHFTYVIVALKCSLDKNDSSRDVNYREKEFRVNLNNDKRLHYQVMNVIYNAYRYISAKILIKGNSPI